MKGDSKGKTRGQEAEVKEMPSSFVRLRRIQRELALKEGALKGQARTFTDGHGCRKRRFASVGLKGFELKWH